MVDTKEIKESLQREVEALTKARDELKLQLALAKNEAKDEWTRLEGSFERLQGEIKRIGIDAREPLKDIGTAVQHLVDELKKGVSRVKTEVKSDVADATNRRAD
jgi:gas vesicle protein